MAIVAVSTKPSTCKLCNSPKVGASTDFTLNEGNTFICHECGTYMIVQETTPTTINASFQECQHCETLGEVRAEGGEEWCGACGLDPSEDLESSDLSILWKKGSEIRRIMTEERSGLAPDKAAGIFLRRFCGPHCNFATQCNQTIKNLATCIRESKVGVSNSEMSKKSRKRRKEEREQSQLSNYKEKPNQARLQCAKSGWLERYIVDGTDNPQQADGKEPGSGTS